jgi:hypothetical protein
MTPMLAEKPAGPAPAQGAVATAAAGSTDPAAAQAARTQRRVAQRPANDFDSQSSWYRPDSRPFYPRQQPYQFNFGGLFGGRW